MRIKANAKINLTLDITGKRADGYHLLDSIMQSVSLCDIVTVEKNDDITVMCDNGDISGESNICHKAAAKFFEATNVFGGAKISIEKHIPLAAGMGGGSADAAAVICALDKIYQTNLSVSELCEIALLVGADVPFCIVGGTARVQGIGEKIKPLPLYNGGVFLLVKRGEKLSTADMYGKIDSIEKIPCTTPAAVEAIESGDLEKLYKNVGNAFSLVEHNETLFDDIKATEPQAASLSGSGPTVFAIYKNLCDANRAAEELKQNGYNPIIAEPVDSGIIFE